jgi:hypothetical protein
MGVLSADRLFVAFDAGSVSAALVRRGAGRARVRGFSRVDLDPGALVPSLAGANLVRPDAVGECLRRALDALDHDGHRATLVLPDGIARLVPVDLPPGAEPRDFVRFRLASSLPFPLSEAAVDVFRVGRRRAVAAAVRSATVARYEQLASTGGLSVDRVHLAPLLAVEGLLSRSRDAVHLVLGDVALCLAVVRGGELVAFRSRRRAPGLDEATWLRDEAERAARRAGARNGDLDLVISGSGSAQLRPALGAPPVELAREERGWAPEAAEAGWLVGTLA